MTKYIQNGIPNHNPLYLMLYIKQYKPTKRRYRWRATSQATPS